MRIEVYRAYLQAQAAAEALLISHTFEDDEHYLRVGREKLQAAIRQLDEIEAQSTKADA